MVGCVTRRGVGGGGVGRGLPWAFTGLFGTGRGFGAWCVESFGRGGGVLVGAVLLVLVLVSAWAAPPMAVDRVDGKLGMGRGRKGKKRCRRGRILCARGCGG